MMNHSHCLHNMVQICSEGIFRHHVCIKYKLRSFLSRVASLVFPQSLSSVMKSFLILHMVQVFALRNRLL